MKSSEDSTYYIDRKKTYWRKLGRIMRSSNRIIPRYLDASITENIAEETKADFENLLKELPYVGGDGNLLTWNLVASAAALAYIRALERRGLTTETIGTLLNEVYADAFDSLPWFVKRFFGWYLLSRWRRKKLRAFAAELQSRRYPDNWVMEYVAGDGVDFDFGSNYTQCAILIFFQKQGAKKYMPYLCATDYSLSRAFSMGLQRTMTLALGGQCCDFRLKKNRPTVPPLPLEGLAEYRNRRS
jgi:hypothetical protein